MQAMARKTRLAVLAALLLLPSAQIRSENNVSWLAAAGVVGIATGIYAALEFRLHSKHPTKDFNSRYNLRECFKVQNILTQRYWRNLWHTIDRGLIGQKGKTSSLKAGPDGGIRWSQDVDSCGILGVAHDYEKPIKDTGAILVAVGGIGILFYNIINNPERIKEFLLGIDDKKINSEKKVDSDPLSQPDTQPSSSEFTKLQQEFLELKGQHKTDIDLLKQTLDSVTQLITQVTKPAEKGNGRLTHQNN